jgi:serine/threonine-protein kinase
VPSHDSAQDALATAWATIGVSGSALTVAPRGQLLPELGAATTVRQAFRELPRLVDSDPEAHPYVALGDELARGAMGVVRLGTQPALARQVAVKQLHADRASPEAELALLQEARIAGRLEHPNIVPIHAAGTDAQGRTLVVMKRIEGRSWGALLRLEPRDPGLSKAALERHLEILMGVSRAVEYAHASGVLHRDLKPDNVMIGGFGDVYVVDWGIAVALTRDATTGLAQAGGLDGVAGTPQYMAPEMAVGVGQGLSERSDVYLLGAILHEILVGAPPHLGQSVLEVLAAAYRSLPKTYSEWVPDELQALCHEAMAADPAQRCPSARDFRERLAAYLEHRHSVELAAEAAERLRELSKLPGDLLSPQTYALFSEARFAFRQAKKGWAGNPAAAHGERDAVAWMAERELTHGSPETASRLLAQVLEPPPDLARRVAAAVSARAEQAVRFQALERERMRDVALPLRIMLSVFTGFAWLAIGLWFGDLWRTRPDAFAPWMVAATFLGSIAVVIVSTAAVPRLRQGVLGNAHNQRLFSLLMTCWAGYAVIWLLAPLATFTVPAAMIAQLMVALMASIVATAGMDRRLWPQIPSCVGAIAAILAWPSYTFDIFGICTCTAIAGTGVAWGLMQRLDET